MEGLGKMRTGMTALALALVSGLTGMGASERVVRVRTFDFEYKATMERPPDGAMVMDLWLPVPVVDAWQQIGSLHIESDYPYRIAKSADGNAILHIGIDKPTFPISVKMSFQANRKEHLESQLVNAAELSKEEFRMQLAPFLKPDRLVPLDGQIRAWAQDVVDKAGARSDIEKARAIYNHVVATVKYDKSGNGWGRGDIYYACEARRGNCTDFHAIFIGYCRALGIPARFAIGFPLPVDRGTGKIAGYHCWAEFYAKNIGWVPIDASEAAKNPAKREYFFGAHDENRVEFSRGRDLNLMPAQKGPPLNYFIYPYAEMDGQPFSGIRYEVSYRDRSADVPVGPAS